MKIKIINAEGVEEEIEAFTPEEVKVQIDGVKSEYDTKIAEKDTSLAALASEKTELEKKLGGAKEDSPNFKALKEALDKKDADITALRTDLDKDRTARKDSFVNSLLAKVTRGDAEVEKKIKFHLENTVAGMKADTDEEVAKKVEAAVKLSQDADGPGIFDGGLGGGGSFNMNGGGNKVEFDAREKALGAKMGITDEDYKKYGPRLINKR